MSVKRKCRDKPNSNDGVIKMLRNIDVEHLASLMNDENSWWAWTINGGKHYITNRHFAFVVDHKEAEDEETGWELLDLLEEKFEKKTPVADKSLILNHGAVSESELKLADSIKKQFETKSTNAGVVTPFIYSVDNFRHRWSKFKSFNLFIQDKYISLLYDAVNEPIFSDGPESPAFLCDGQFIILPIRNMDKKVDFGQFNDFEELVKSLEIA